MERKDKRPENNNSNARNRDNKSDSGLKIIDLDNESLEGPEGRSPKEKKHLKKRYIVLLTVVGLMIASYLVFVFAPIPFVRKWRDIYIETAMSTNSHKWLATAFIPGFIVDEVMDRVRAEQARQKELESKWDEEIAEVEEEEEVDVFKAFFEKYWELDSPSFRSYLDQHSIDTEEKLNNLYFTDLSGDLGVMTSKGDAVLSCNIPNSTLLLEVKGADYVGKMAVVKDPSLVCQGKSSYLGSRGQIIDDFGNNYDALLAINASGFKDVDGHGSGGQINGSLVIDGEDYGTIDTAKLKFYGMKFDNKFYIANPWNVDVSEYRWGMQFFPALVVDGECVVAGTYGMGIQPRTTVGQAQDGTFIMLIVDGRQVGYSLGCTMEECANQMIKYGVYQAANFDGGSSSIMWFEGAQITRSSSPSGFGRYLPNAIYIKKVTTSSAVSTSTP
ncbi:MAG: phosphodiester glycosidase family protein [Lachnospiraceae bacterium]|nr:phosphodiester glycosidase family protein [Lachnospiraceae bacterium]